MLLKSVLVAIVAIGAALYLGLLEYFDLYGAETLGFDKALAHFSRWLPGSLAVGAGAAGCAWLVARIHSVAANQANKSFEGKGKRISPAAARLGLLSLSFHVIAMGGISVAIGHWFLIALNAPPVLLLGGAGIWRATHGDRQPAASERAVVSSFSRSARSLATVYGVISIPCAALAFSADPKDRLLLAISLSITFLSLAHLALAAYARRLTRQWS